MTTTVEVPAPVVTGLTRDDLSALREADSVTFHTHGGRSFIRAYMGPRHRKPPVVTVREQRVFNRTDVPLAYDRGRDVECATVARSYAGRRDGLSAECFHNVYRADQVWLTVASLLKVGDRVTLRWTASNNNQYADDARLHVDELHLSVDRGGKRLTFAIGHNVCADNSARMVQFV